MDKRELLVRNRTGIVAYIQSTTLLSRSLIYHVLSVLESGGYIRIVRGKLEEIVHLPENF
ncbi:putative DNA-binding transcriptional regulator [compost metagenome]